MATMQERTPGRRGSALGVVALLATSVLVALLLGEIGTRLLMPRPGQFLPREPDNLEGLLVPHATRGFAYAAGFSDTVLRDGRAIPFTTNELGLRDRPLGPKAEGERRVLAIGDSYTVGWGVLSEEAWPSRLERSLADRGPGIRVVNAGTSGYSARSVRVALTELIPLVQPDVVVLGHYAAGSDRMSDPFVLQNGDLVRESERGRVRVVEGGTLHTRMFRPWMQELDFWLDQRCWLCAYAFQAAYRVYEGMGAGSGAPVAAGSVAQAPDREAADEAAALVELARADSVARAMGVPMLAFLIVREVVPGRLSSFDPDANGRAAAYARARGLPVLDPTAMFADALRRGVELRLPTDEHWSPAAHGMVADTLAIVLSLPEYPFRQRLWP